MRAAQLYIKSTTKYIQLRQDGDFPFTLSKSIAEIQDISKRNKTFSKTFKIPFNQSMLIQSPTFSDADVKRRLS